ncbi:hypothetical protein AWC02_05255 [Mycolicibacter engbaekii]|uniref:Uncharacterized protein n=1 Tax=Mycolicibacter engbaekii TaxID=188915 RepID=A0A1X1TZZ6_9MYCO|nr:hypothetical protein [Mycolicibacter engbaekii]ORV49988.1 hypothetical protein AWC02_05255 [Mycolicibacter engbaekii]
MSDEIYRIQARWHDEELEQVSLRAADQRVLLHLPDVASGLQRLRRLQDSQLELLQREIDELILRQELTIRQSKLDQNLDLEEYHARRQSLLDRADALGIGIRRGPVRTDSGATPDKRLHDRLQRLLNPDAALGTGIRQGYVETDSGGPHAKRLRERLQRAQERAEATHRDR